MTIDDQPATETDGDLAAVLQALSLHVIDRQSIEDTLDQVARLARDGIQAADYAAVTTLRDGVPETTVATDPMLALIDQVQYDLDTGPCLDAYRTGEVLRIEDTADEERWPKFAEAAADRGIRAMLSLPLMTEREGIGALNLYSETARSFGPADQQTALRFSEPAAVLLANAQMFWEARKLADNLGAALESRAIIEQAKGILMALQGVDADGAFDIMRRASQRENRKLREIAQRLVDRVVSRKGQQPRKDQNGSTGRS
jgi:GAF domain-containing protein